MAGKSGEVMTAGKRPRGEEEGTVTGGKQSRGEESGAALQVVRLQDLQATVQSQAMSTGMPGTSGEAIGHRSTQLVVMLATPITEGTPKEVGVLSDHTRVASASKAAGKSCSGSGGKWILGDRVA